MFLFLVQLAIGYFLGSRQGAFPGICHPDDQRRTEVLPAEVKSLPEASTDPCNAHEVALASRQQVQLSSPLEN